MILFIFGGFLLAKLKGYKLLPAFKVPYLFPLYLLEILYICIQFGFVIGNHALLNYAGYLQIAFIAVLILPIIKYSINLPAVFSAISVLIGSRLNLAVMNANDGMMPVFPTLSKLTKYYTEDSITKINDGRHVLGSSETKLAFLADYIDIGWTILSPGDVLIHSFITVIVYYTIKSINIKNNQSDTLCLEV